MLADSERNRGTIFKKFSTTNKDYINYSLRNNTKNAFFCVSVCIRSRELESPLVFTDHVNYPGLIY